MSLYLGENCISAGGSSAFRNNNIGEIIQSTIPLTDAGLHLLDGSLISGGGAYSAFVDYMANLYSTAAKASNVDVVGSLTDNNGVLSGFSTSNYCWIPTAFSPNSSTWDIVLKYKTPATASDYVYILGSNAYNINIAITPSYQLAAYISSNGTSWNIASHVASSSTLSSSTEYYIKVQFTGTNYIVSVSTDGTTYTDYITISSSTPVYSGVQLRFGLSRSGAGVFNGQTYDLNSSYININGSRWWTGRTPECFTDEAQWQASVSTYGVCGKFVYDSVNNTVRLPKITGFTEGTIDPTVLGDLVEAGLPNITGDALLGHNTAAFPPAVVTGCFNKTDSRSFGTAAGNTTITTESTLVFDASQSNSIYGNSTTVQPQSIKVLYYIVIATSTKTDIEVDIDEVMTDLNGKADVDLSNVNNSGTSLASGWSMPSGRYIDLTLGASASTYTAPANGWFYISKETTGAQYVEFVNLVSGFSSGSVYYSTFHVVAFIPARKGDAIQLNYNAGGTLNAFRFYYTEGENV